MSDEMRVDVVRDGDATVVAPVGEVDLSRSPRLRQVLREAQAAKPRRVIVDLSSVDYMDSSGVATLVEAYQIARRDKSKMVLCALTERVRAIFEIAKLDTIFTITATRQEAKEA